MNPPADAVLVVAAAGGVRLQLRVKPGGRSDRLLGPHDGALKLEVRAAPERGRANDAVVRLLAAILDIGRSQVGVVAGATGRDKVVVIGGISVAEVARRLEAAGVPARVGSGLGSGEIGPPSGSASASAPASGFAPSSVSVPHPERAATIHLELPRALEHRWRQGSELRDASGARPVEDDSGAEAGAAAGEGQPALARDSRTEARRRCRRSSGRGPFPRCRAAGRTTPGRRRSAGRAT